MSRWAGDAQAEGDLKPFLAHLEDLRRLLIRCALVVALGMGVALPLTPFILRLLKAPLYGLVENPEHFLWSMDVAGAFTSTMRIALWSGLVMAAPLLVLIIGAYLLPALTPRERESVGGVGVAGILLFAMGVWLGYRFTLPFTLSAMFAVHAWLGVQAQWTLTSYVTFTTQLLIAFGLAFEIPVVLLILGRLGIVTSTWLRTYRRHAIVSALIIGAVLTPPDVFSQMILAGPLILLYEICVWVVWTWERAARREAGTPAPTKEVGP
jgi:sec-independent protein translocase protein TatC